MSALSAPEGVRFDASVIEKACQEGMALITTDLSAYRIAGLMSAHGID